MRWTVACEACRTQIFLGTDIRLGIEVHYTCPGCEREVVCHVAETAAQVFRKIMKAPSLKD